MEPSEKENHWLKSAKRDGIYDRSQKGTVFLVKLYMHTDDKHEGMDIYEHDGSGSLLFNRAI